jgi:hypothetical protein
MGSTLTTFAALLKENYIDSSEVEKLVYPDHPLLGMLEKRGDTGMVGDKLPVPWFYGNPQGASSSFSTAQTNATNTKSVQFDIQSGDYHGVVMIGDKVIEASRSNKGAFLENKLVEIDGLYETLGENHGTYIWGNGGNALGRIAAIDSNVLTLTEASDAMNFELDMEVVASDNDGSTSTDALRDSGDSTAVTAVNRALGTVTIVVADISALAVGDYLFRAGDFFGDTATVIYKGMQCWITSSDSPMALWGVTANTRATDPQRFGGCRVNSTLVNGKTFEERIKILLAQMSGRFKTKTGNLSGFMHPEDFQVLETLMAAKGIRPLEDESTKFGYSKISIATGAGTVPIYCDRHAPKGTFFVFKMDDFWISSMGELFHPQMGDGLEILRRYNSTDYEFRLISYPLLACRAAKNSGRVPLY